MNDGKHSQEAEAHCRQEKMWNWCWKAIVLLWQKIDEVKMSLALTNLVEKRN